MKITTTIIALAAGTTVAAAQGAPPTPPPPARVVPGERPAPKPSRNGLPPIAWQVPVEMPMPWPIEAPMAPGVEWHSFDLTPLPSIEWPTAPIEAPVLPGVEWRSFDLAPVMPGVEWRSFDLAPLPPVGWPTPAVAPVEAITPLPPGVPGMTWETPLPQGGPPSARSREEVRMRQEELMRERELQRLLSRDQAELARELSRLESELSRDLARQESMIQRDLVRENSRMAQDIARENSRMAQEMARQQGRLLGEFSGALHVDWPHFDLSTTHVEAVRAPSPWAGTQDVGDSVYRAARDLFNRGEWGQAAAAFRALPQRYPNSQYASEASYYEAFSLYRIGGTPELRAALAALDAQRTRYPNARSRTEAATLATRIRGVLASRGDAQAAAELARTADQQGGTCDKEEQAVQAEAMNALSRSDAANVNELITRVLARRDECSIPLRRTAVFLVGNRRDAQAVTILAGVARNDPANQVRSEAINVLGRLPSDEAAAVLEEIARSTEEEVQRAAVRALVRHSSARARTYVRNLVDSDAVSERVRSDALSAFNADRATAEDVAWLRALYAKVQSPTLKSRTLSAIVRIGGPDVDQWLVSIASSETERSELRATAMRRIGASMSITDLGRLYDGATQQRFRREIITVLGKRTEDAATDKLIDIVKNGTDPSLRTAAIRAISEKDNARAQQLLLEIINK
jgi:TolA-binding protein